VWAGREESRQLRWWDFERLQYLIQCAINSRMQAYRNDLAYIHDVGFGDYARNSAPGLLKILNDAGISEGLVVDLGCGSGVWARELVNKGYEVLGVDISPSMIEIARARVPEARFENSSLLKFKIPHCNAVTSLGECFNYLFDMTNRLSSLRQLFGRIYKALEPGGLLIFDIAEPGRGRGPRQKHLEGADWTCLVDVDEDSKSNKLTRKIVTFRKVGNTFQRDEEVHRLKLYRRSDLAKELRREGFRVRTLGAYGKQPMIFGCVGFLARKPQ
jgi:SAM-dependent methyltransferase